MKKDALYRLAAHAITAVALSLFIPISTSAADPAASNEWKYSADIYLWGSGIKGTTQTGGDLDFSFEDILDNLDMAFMGGLTAEKGKWSLLVDAIYLNVANSKGGTEQVPILGNFSVPVEVELDVKLKAWITTFGAAYNLVDSGKVKLGLVGGGRYLWMDVETKKDLSGLNTSRKEKFSGSDNVLDAIVGVRGTVTLNDKWYMPYYVDVGTGQSDLTWQALVGVGYKFNWGDVLLAYRYMDYDFKSDVPLKDMSMNGPALGVRFFF